MSLRLTALAAVAAAGLLTSPAFAAVNLVTNGSFETGPNPGGFTTLFAPSSAIAGWTVAGGTVDYIGNYWQASDGVRSIDLNGNSPGVLSQIISGLVAGRTYNVAFDLAGNVDDGPALKQLQVTVGSAVYNTTFDITGNSRAAMGWEGRAFSFVAGGSSATLAFTSNSTTTCCWGPALDNVSVTAAVPEPATWAMMLIGFAGLGLARQRRQRALAA